MNGLSLPSLAIAAAIFVWFAALVYKTIDSWSGRLTAGYVLGIAAQWGLWILGSLVLLSMSPSLRSGAPSPPVSPTGVRFGLSCLALVCLLVLIIWLLGLLRSAASENPRQSVAWHLVDHPVEWGLWFLWLLFVLYLFVRVLLPPGPS
jgi:hypothetical protein